MVLRVLIRVARISFEDAAKACAPPLLVLVLITVVPDTVLWMPRTLKELGRP
jgi:hypothetical protein